MVIIELDQTQINILWNNALADIRRISEEDLTPRQKAAQKKEVLKRLAQNLGLDSDSLPLVRVEITGVPCLEDLQRLLPEAKGQEEGPVLDLANFGLIVCGKNPVVDREGRLLVVAQAVTPVETLSDLVKRFGLDQLNLVPGLPNLSFRVIYQD